MLMCAFVPQTFHWLYVILKVLKLLAGGQQLSVACAGHLQKLDLASFGLSCPFPVESLALFPSLQILVLAENAELTVRPCIYASDGSHTDCEDGKA